MNLQAFLLLAFSLSASVVAIPQNAASSVNVQLQNHRPTTTTKITKPTGTPCVGNTPLTRSRWCQYDINTDYTQIVPNTGVTREYWLNVEELVAAPDGFSRPVMAVNGTIPGPTIFADWGDEVVIHVTNSLHNAKNGTSIHWHGIRQNYTNGNDGVVSITQCPTAPGSTITYKWRATQYGSSWYHSHIGLQAWEGVFGGIVINGPATANYQVDKGSLFLTDWSHPTVDELYLEAQTIGPPTLDTGLINGTNVFGNGTNSTGTRFQMKVNQGSSYRLRIVNSAVDTHWKFMIDNHTLTVIAADFVPIKPFTTDYINIGMGQRYDVIVTANKRQISDSFWIRAIPQEACSENANPDNIRGILYYGNSPNTPTTRPYTFPDECTDEPASSLIPQVPKTVSAADWNNLTDVTLGRNTANLFRWYLNSTTMQVLWEDPTLLQLFNNENTPNFTESSGVIELPRANEWVYLMINTSFPVTHPIHMHGHDFFVLAQGSNPWDGSVATNNPPRRDTAMLNGNGYLLMAFETDNPGAWLMHCHIGWHTDEGFALQFLERESEIEPLIDRRALEDNCASWNAYDEAFDIEQDDSGV
ncbi:CAZyme family AA1 [Penicillium roqueforti]|nr:CAZyme family AA1 [Penicillium roqueforti]KAI3124936.1 CAZyme family AA1 [Penicillium roqueforti]KAI3199538.1 CAZyme family AA1 [Penicillium roqueforti]KAI3269642.1 CAZyme family AA1 [Penicillium roqueforti]KAI3292778.1 CAZyme family AA1 [Penicillium roqueforti]